ncbi:MAG: hypothetical protein AAB305_07330 [Candidatus Zixiibacteriota bacterium]
MKYIMLVLSVTLACSGCTDRNKYIASNRETIQLQGTLQSLVCGSWDPWHYPPMPFVERTGEHPSISVIYTDNTTETFSVDDSSRFSLPIIPGPCKIAVTSRYTYPADTFQFYFDRDTTLEIDINLHVLEPDTLAVMFWYSAVPDSTATAKEWKTLNLFNAYLGGSLRIEGEQPHSEWRSFNTEYVMYATWHVPVRDSSFNVLAVHYHAEDVLLADTLYFNNMDVYPHGVYACFGKK